MRRLPHKREYYIPKGSTKVSDKHSSAVAYFLAEPRRLNKHGVPKTWIVGFSGKAQKPSINELWNKRESAYSRIEDFFAGVRAHETSRRNEKLERNSAERGLEVGDLLKCSWGYDQTNIDFYEVTKLIGKRSVELRAIASESVETGFMCGQCVPIPGKYIGKAFRKQARNGGVRMTSYSYATKMTPKEPVPGARIYETSYWSSYA